MEEITGDWKPVFHWRAVAIVWMVNAPMGNRIRLYLRELAELEEV